jgi:RNA polymerase sigma-70 factor, ECF subfamily
MDESALIQSARKGDLEAFNRLVLVYQEQVFNLAYRMLSAPEPAADAAQNTFLSAYRHINDYRGGSFRSWLLRIASNSCLDELRRQKRRPTTPLEPLDSSDEEEVESPRWLADDRPTPEQALESRELDRAIQNCLEGLEAEFRAVVIMVDIEGLDYQEASAAIGKPLGTIKSRLARARSRLQNCLQGYAELLPQKFRLLREERA